MNRRDIADFITQQKRSISSFEYRAWDFVAMLNDTRNEESFLSMLLAYWLDTQQELAKPPDNEWQEVHRRDEKVYGLVLTHLSIDLASIKKSEDGKHIYYNFLQDEKH